MNGKTNSTKAGDTIINGVLLPLEPPASLTTLGENQSILIQWTDPADKYTNPGEELVVEWDHSTIVRKETGAPNTPDDGVLVATENTRDQYSQTAYRDEGLENGKAYYYSVFSHSTNGMYSLSQSEAIAAKSDIYNMGIASEALSHSMNFPPAPVGNYVLFGGGESSGGISSPNTWYYDVDAYDISFTKNTNISDLSRVSGKAPTRIGNYLKNDYALFYSSDDSAVIDVYNSSLTKTTPGTTIATYQYGYRGQLGNDYAIFSNVTWQDSATVWMVNRSFTGQNITPDLELFSSTSIDAIAYNGDYVAFMMYQSSSPYPIIAMNTSLTTTRLEDPTNITSQMMVRASGGAVSTYMMFPSNSNRIDAYNENLTHTVISTTVTPDANNGEAQWGECVTVQGWGIFFGNKYASSSYKTVTYIFDPLLTCTKKESDFISPRDYEIGRFHEAVPLLNDRAVCFAQETFAGTTTLNGYPVMYQIR